MLVEFAFSIFRVRPSMVYNQADGKHTHRSVLLQGLVHGLLRGEGNEAETTGLSRVTVVDQLGISQHDTHGTLASEISPQSWKNSYS